MIWGGAKLELGGASVLRMRRKLYGYDRPSKALLVKSSRCHQYSSKDASSDTV